MSVGHSISRFIFLYEMRNRGPTLFYVFFNPPEPCYPKSGNKDKGHNKSASEKNKSPSSKEYEKIIQKQLLY